MKNSFSILLVYLMVFQSSFVLVAEAQNQNLDVSGRNGADGANGSDGNSGIYSGSRGGDGQNAGPATRGQNAGDLSIEIKRTNDSTVPVNGNVIIRGEIRAPKTSGQLIENNIQLGNSGEINFYAVGGNGGNGGKGGDGGRGGRGSDGSDATQYSSGTSGGNGGRGGDGGNGTSGENGGRGGKVTVTVNQNNTDLLMLIGEVSVAGGRGGRAGANGSGGAGGAGGRGGSSYSWSETRATGKDAQGNTTYTTDYHSNSGGFDGSRGSSGSDGSAQLSSGRDGDSGNFKIRVVGSEGVKEYQNRYDLRVISYGIQSENKDGIFEPGENGYIENVKVRNFGEMPTPPNFPVEVSLPDGSWIRSKWEKFQISKSLAQNEEFTIPIKFNFSLRDIKAPETDGRFRSQEKASLEGLQKGVDRKHKNFPLIQGFEVTFPIEISPIMAPESLLPGQTARVYWKVKNISDRDFGALSDLKREIATRLKTDLQTITSEQFEFRDTKGNLVSLDRGFFVAVSSLKAKEEAIIEGRISLKPTAVPYTKVGLKNHLDIGKINEPSNKRNVQFQDLVINIAQAYKKTPGSKILLVTNNQSVPEEINSWMRLFKRMGLAADIWDTSYEGFLAFHRVLNGTSRTLGDDFSKATVVLLNNDRVYKADTTKRIQADAMIPKKDLLESAAKSKINFYMVGKSQKHNNDIISFFLLPSLHAEAETFSADKDLLKSLRERNGSSAQIGLVGNRVIQERWFFQVPQPETIEKMSQRLQRELNVNFPDSRFFVIHGFSGNILNEKGIGKKYEIGNIQVFQSLPSTESSITALAATNEVLHTRSFIESRMNIRGFLSSLPLDQKIDLFKASLSQTVPHQDILLDALLVDVATEQTSIRLVDVNANISSRLKVLKRITDRLAREVEPSLLQSSSARARQSAGVILELYSKISYLAGKYVEWYMLSDLFSTNRNVRNATNEILTNAVDRGFGRREKGRFFGENFVSKDDRANNKLAKETFEKAKADLERKSKAGLENIEGALTQTMGHDQMSRDTTLVNDSNARILSREDYIRVHREKNWIEAQQRIYQERRERERQEVEESSNPSTVSP